MLRTSSSDGAMRAAMPIAKKVSAPHSVAISRDHPKYPATNEYTCPLSKLPEYMNRASISAHSAA